MKASAYPPSSGRAGHCCRPLWRSSFIAGQSHDGIGAQGDIAASPQVSDEARASTGLAAGISPDDPHYLAVEFEIHIGVRQETGPLADVGRYGYLSLRCDSHGWSLLLQVRIGNVPPRRNAGTVEG